MIMIMIITSQKFQ